MTSKSPPFRDPYQRLEQPFETPGFDATFSDAPPMQHSLPVRHQRRTFVLASLALTVGLLLVGFQSDFRSELIAPGPLAFSHAQILNAQGEKRCGTCHGAGNLNFVDWAQDAFQAGKHATTNQSHLCLACHNKTLNEQTALYAHGMPSEHLAKLTLAKTANWSVASNSTSSKSSSEIACSACHREHHGNQFDLTSIDDNKCQSCHVQTFSNFTGSHPEFSVAGVSIGNRAIAFDHRTHLNKHFPEKASTFDCNQCHMASTDGGQFITRDFDVSCARCHSDSLAATLQDDSPLWRLPTLPITQMSAAGLDVGYWPQNRFGDFDGQLTPLMTALLLADESVSTEIRKRGLKIDFFDLDGEDADDLRFAYNLANSIKRLAEELQTDSQQVISRRLRASFDENLSQKLMAISNLLNGKQLQLAAAELVAPKSAAISLQKFIAATQMRYQDQEELAPNPLKGLFGEVQPETTRDEEHPSELKQPPESSLSAQQEQAILPTASSGELLATNPLKTIIGELQPTRPLEQPTQKDYALGTANLDQVQQPDQTKIENKPWEPPSKVVENSDSKATNYFANDSVDNLDSNGVTKYAMENQLSAENAERLPAAESFSSQLQADFSPTSSKFALGRQYRNADGELVYSDAGHYDLLLRALTDAVQTSTDGEFATIFGAMSMIQDCRRCHNHFEKYGATQLASVRAFDSSFNKAFSKFSHRPHTLLRDCNSCHQFTNIESPNPDHTKSDLVGISKESCAECHRENGAPDNCSHCHQYHQSTPILPRDIASPLDERIHR
ncbi:MAG: hypothetical protein R3C03_22645 [Pirellulaceae bacterium]